MAPRTPSYLQPTASTTQRAASSVPSKRTQTSNKYTPPQSRAVSNPVKVSQPILSARSNPPTREDLKLSVSTTQSAPPTTQLTHSVLTEDPSTPSEPFRDGLQVAAQVQSWLFMQSDLQECFAAVQKGAQDSHAELAEATSNSTSLGSRATRWEAENLVVFLDDLVKAGPDPHLALTISKFLEHEKSWLTLQSEVTQFVARLSQAPTDLPLKEGQSIKAHLDEEALRIASLVTEVESWNNGTDPFRHLLAQLHPVLIARSGNASMALDAIDCSLDNIRAMRRLRV